LKSFRSYFPHLFRFLPILADFGKFPSHRFSHSVVPFFIYLSFNPPHNQSHNMIDFRLIQSPALLYCMPLLNAPPATCGCRMLSNENRMTPHRCLSTIIFWKIRCNSRVYKLECMVFDGFDTFGDNVISVFLC